MSSKKITDTAYTEERKDSVNSGEDRALPPRSKVHPSEKGKWTVRFYLSLVFLFIALIVSMIGLYYWKLQ